MSTVEGQAQDDDQLNKSTAPHQNEHPVGQREAEPVSQLDAARADLALGFHSVPIPPREKAPRIEKWQELRLTEDDLPDHFGDGENRGLILGEPSGGLVDVDLDCEEAVALAPTFLPDTERRHGRKSKRESHRWYVCSDDEIRTRQFKDVNGTMLVELRSTGGQTVVPPSIHPSGEQLLAHATGEPAVVDRSEIEAAVARLAAAALIARHWPQAGSRHDAALALAGTVLRGGMPVEEVSHFIAAVAEAAGDDEVDDRTRAATTTAENMAAGEEFTAGPRLAELLGNEVAERLGKWLGLRRGPVGGVGNQAVPDLEEAKAQLAHLVADAAENGDDAIRRALECSDLLASFATVAECSPGDYEAALVQLRSGAKAKNVDSLQRAVRKEGIRGRRERTDMNNIQYEETPFGMAWLKSSSDGVTPIPLTNFTARITTNVEEDDGVDTHRSLEILAEQNGRQTQFAIAATEFSGMQWPICHLGPEAIVYPGFGIRDHARAAIQILSGSVPRRRIYTHTGWRKFDTGWMYLHANGAIGENGLTDAVRVQLGGMLSNYELPEPPTGSALINAVSASLSLLDVVPDPIGIPLLAATYRAALFTADFTVHVAGQTGTGKTELAALCQQHFGRKLDARNIPGSWSSTANANEALAFGAKDALLTVDDFAPSGSKHDVGRAHRDAERLLRAQGNNSGRGRMRADSTLRTSKPPRGLILSTGEDIPRGHSIRARTLILEMSPDSMNWERLTVCQRNAMRGLNAQSMSAFLKWLAPNYERTRRDLIMRVRQQMTQNLETDQHRRTPSIIAHLYEGWALFVQFAQEIGAISEQRRRELLDRGLQALREAGDAQAQYHAANDPAQRFIELLTAILASGKGHVASAEGGCPQDPKAWGWRYDNDTWRPQGDRIGWVDGGDLYLEPEAAYATVQRFAGDGGDSISLNNTTLRRRLREKRLLASTDERRSKLTVRRTLGGIRREVLHLPATSICPKPAQSAQVVHDYPTEPFDLPDGAPEMTEDNA